MLTSILQVYQKISEDGEPLSVGFGFKSYCFSINERPSKFQGCCQSRKPKHNFIFPPFGNDFYLHQKISH